MRLLFFAWIFSLFFVGPLVAAVHGVQAGGVGGATLAGAWGSDAVYGNPAALARFAERSLSAGWQSGDDGTADYLTIALPIKGAGVGAMGASRCPSEDEITLGWGRMFLERSAGGHLALGASVALTDRDHEGTTIVTIAGVHADLLPFVSVAAQCPVLQSGSARIDRTPSLGFSLRWGEEFEWLADLDSSGGARLGAEIRPSGTGIRLRVGKNDHGPTVGTGWAQGDVRIDASWSLDEADRLLFSAGVAWFPGSGAP